MSEQPRQRMHDLALKGAGMQRPTGPGVHFVTTTELQDPLATEEIVDSSAGAEEIQQAIVAAIAAMDKDAPDSWTKTKGPRVAALEAVLGYQITEAERDSAWQIFNQRG